MFVRASTSSGPLSTFCDFLQILEQLPSKDVCGDVGDVEAIGAAKETLRKAHDEHRGKIL